MTRLSNYFMPTVKEAPADAEGIEKPKQLPNRISHVFVYAYEPVANPEPPPASLRVRSHASSFARVG